MPHTSSIAAVQSRFARIALVALMLIAGLALSAASAQAASFTISKETQPASDATKFDFHVEFRAQPNSGDTGTSVPDFSLAGGESKTFADVQKGFYTVSERTAAGWKLVDITCAPPDKDPQDVYGIDLANSRVEIELSADENKGCTFVNRKDSTLRVVKATNPAGSTATFAFAGPDGSFSLSDAGVKEWTVAPGSYQVTEQATAGWSLSGIACDDADSTTAGSTATANVGVGETVTCTFTNAQVISGLTQGAGQSPAAITPTLRPNTSARPTPARARLLAPKRCVSRRFTVAVEGGPVRSVTFYVNGRRVATVTARGNQRRFTTTLPSGVAVSKIRARVTFKAGASQRSRTLSTTVRRCSRGAVAPQFTG